MRTNYFIILVRPDRETVVQTELDKNLSMVNSFMWQTRTDLSNLRELKVSVNDDTSLLDACVLYYELIQISTTYKYA